MPTPMEGRPGGARVAREGTWRVDDLLVDAGRRVVCRGDHRLGVTGLSLDVLLALIDAAPNLLDTDELMDRVWGHVVVSPETLTQRIKLLRDAIGDDPRQPRYIQGVRGRGYRLLPVPERFHAGTPRPDGAPRLARWVLATLAIVALAVLTWSVLRPVRESAALPPLGGDGVAVLPFRNVDSSEAGATLADGMAEALLHRLASLDGVKVISRYSSFAASAEGLSPTAIGRRLHARYLLEGSVQGGAQGLRVRAALTDVADGRQLWSLQFDRGRDDLLAIQDEIAARVARTFAQTAQAGREPVAGSASGASSAGTSSAVAQLAYLQGRALADRMIISDLDTAVSRFKEATRIDPTFAAAQAAAAAALLTREELRSDQRAKLQPGILAEAEQRVAAAIATDGDNGEALIARARIEASRGEYDAAERDFRAGLGARPNDADAHLQYARFLFYGLDPFERPKSAAAASRVEDRYEQALHHCDRATQLDPLSPTAYFVRGQMTLHLGDATAADRYFENALRLDPNLPPALGRLAQLRWMNGALADAVLHGERALAIDPQAEWIRRMLSQYYVEIDDVPAAEQVLAEGGPALGDGRLAVLLRQRRWREAAELAFAEAQIQPRTYDRDLAAFALREWARESRADAGRALAVLKDRIAWKQVGGRRVVHHSSRFAALAAADLLIARGAVAEGQALVDAVVQAIRIDEAAAGDSSIVTPLRSDGRAMALAFALSGDTTGALDQLAALVRNRRLRHLWYEMEIQPAFAALRREPEFKALLDEYRAHVKSEREKLAAMRAQVAVPER